MKWIGAMILLIATSWAGIEFAKKLTDRPKQIRQLKNALQVMEAEILYSHATIAEACISVARQLPRPVSEFFEKVGVELGKRNRDLYEIWVENLDDIWQFVSLRENEKEILRQFGRTLGQHDFIQQQKHIQLALSHLERELQEALEQQNRYSKMVKSLGFLTGLLLVLLLI
ncbi:stage III sporulation protein SpoIIIAB [Sediminibacillus massiliensis]|uniref:stage III sporulation protein SpoIIIAB n=1 Tax=Sediminibacillus massiliensis TaxID=1926277 RepID=UPI0009884A12|nr:stage III sporulation protein SpoIIIAB [Sediminibacillus massiliensis]